MNIFTNCESDRLNLNDLIGLLDFCDVILNRKYSIKKESEFRSDKLGPVVDSLDIINHVAHGRSISLRTGSPDACRSLKAYFRYHL